VWKWFSTAPSTLITKEIRRFPRGTLAKRGGSRGSRESSSIWSARSREIAREPVWYAFCTSVRRIESCDIPFHISGVTGTAFVATLTSTCLPPLIISCALSELKTWPFLTQDKSQFLYANSVTVTLTVAVGDRPVTSHPMLFNPFENCLSPWIVCGSEWERVINRRKETVIVGAMRDTIFIAEKS